MLRESLPAFPSSSSSSACCFSSCPIRSSAWVICSSWRLALAAKSRTAGDRFAVFAFQGLDQRQAFFDLVEALRIEFDIFQVQVQISGQVTQAFEDRSGLPRPGWSGTGPGAPELPERGISVRAGRLQLEISGVPSSRASNACWARDVRPSAFARRLRSSRSVSSSPGCRWADFDLFDLDRSAYPPAGRHRALPGGFPPARAGLSCRRW